MRIELPCGKDVIPLELPEGTVVYESRYPPPVADAGAAVLKAIRQPIGAPPLRRALEGRRDGKVVVVVSDATRPIPYPAFLPALLAEVQAAGVRPEEIILLVATGMHRPSTAAERREAYGEAAGRHRVVDHRAGDASGLVELMDPRSGRTAKLNRHYVEAGFSGGRKSICPGLCDLDTIRRFHGAATLADPRACNGNLTGNPCHEEALAIARMAPPDFCLNVVLDRWRRMVAAYGGHFEALHAEACALVRRCACPVVEGEADVVVTSSGGYPLDATFYQCVKGIVSCLPAVKAGGSIVAFGGCSEGIGSDDYARLMRRYAGRWREFLRDISRPGVFTRDQWQLQLQARALEKVGEQNLHFITERLSPEQLAALSVTGHHIAAGELRAAAQDLIDRLTSRAESVAAIPEGPYCAPMPSRQTGRERNGGTAR